MYKKECGGLFQSAEHGCAICHTLTPSHRMMMSSAVVLMEPCKAPVPAMHTNWPPHPQLGVAAQPSCSLEEVSWKINSEESSSSYIQNGIKLLLLTPRLKCIEWTGQTRLLHRHIISSIHHMHVSVEIRTRSDLSCNLGFTDWSFTVSDLFTEWFLVAFWIKCKLAVHISN